MRSKLKNLRNQVKLKFNKQSMLGMDPERVAVAELCNEVLVVNNKTSC